MTSNQCKILSKKAFGDLIYQIIRVATVKSNTPQDYGLATPLYTSEIHMLSAINKSEGLRSVDLTKELGITKGAVSQTLKKLEDKNLVIRKANAIHLTPVGKKILNHHEKKHGKQMESFYAYITNLSEEQQGIAIRTLEEFKKNLEEIDK